MRVAGMDGDVVGVFVFLAPVALQASAQVLRNTHAMMYSILYGYDHKYSRIDQHI